jgi:hypothetical protein
MYYRAVSVPWFTNYLWFCYPTLRIWLFSWNRVVLVRRYIYNLSKPHTPINAPQNSQWPNWMKKNNNKCKAH